MMRGAAAVALLVFLACGPARGEEIAIFAAASLTDVLQEIAKTCEAASGQKLLFNLGASSDLARQIQAGALADVFFSADSAQMDALERAGLVRPADRVDVLSNILVVVVSSDSASRLRSAADLPSATRLALADPEAVPAGVYARTYLQSAGLWDKLKDKVVPTLNVRAALAAVESGNAEAAIVYRTDAAISKRVRVAFEVPRRDGPKIVYVLAPLLHSKSAARDLVRCLVSPEALAAYERRGFLVLPSR